MVPTEMARAAMRVGFDLQLLNWPAFQHGYPKRKSEVEVKLRALGLDLVLPDAVEDYERSANDIFAKVYEHLVAERSRLGGDVYGLTMFVLGYLPLRLVVSAAWRAEEYETLLVNLLSMLKDLSVEGELDTIRREVDVETQWLAEQAVQHDSGIRAEDALRAADRLVKRILALWQRAEGERLSGAVRFDQVPYHSVFISYSTADEEFCARLHETLADAGVRVWFAPHDIQPGQKIHHQVYRAIDGHDKLLIVLSQASTASEWVGTELFKARERERTQGVQVLFPIRLVPYEDLRGWNAFDADSGRDMAREVREYFIPDFSEWRDEAVFEREVDRLVKALAIAEACDDTQAAV